MEVKRWPAPRLNINQDMIHAEVTQTHSRVRRSFDERTNQWAELLIPRRDHPRLTLDLSQHKTIEAGEEKTLLWIGILPRQTGSTAWYL